MTIFEFIIDSANVSLYMQLLTMFMFVGLLYYLIKTRIQGKKDCHDITALRQEVRALTSAAVGVGERVVNIERRQKGVNSGLQKVNFTPSNNENSYERAIHLVKKGADVKDLVNTCGLSLGEADLVKLLHNVHLLNNNKSKQVS